jgi:ElaB/YqjD/DUF883 family membrane-anchored ribosome-binding protein
MQNTVRDLVEEAGQTGTDLKRRAQDVAGNVARKAGEVASEAVHRTGDLASAAAHTVGDTAANVVSTVGRKADDAAAAVGERISSLGGTLRDKAGQGGVLGGAAATAASGLQAGGTYLHEHRLSGVFEDLTALARRHPLQALLIGFGIGFLVARATRKE